MLNINKWSKLAIAVQSVLAAAVTITAITKANPGVATATAHGYANGDYLLLSVQGMTKLDSTVVRVSGVTANTFNLEGIDTTLYDTFTSGTAQKITFGTNLVTVLTVNAEGGDFTLLPVTTVHDDVEKEIPGIAQGSKFSLENIWDIADPGLIALKSASDSQSQRALMFTFATGQKIVFTGYVGATLLPRGEAQNIVKTNAVITMFGKPNYYAS